MVVTTLYRLFQIQMCQLHHFSKTIYIAIIFLNVCSGLYVFLFIIVSLRSKNFKNVNKGKINLLNLLYREFFSVYMNIS